MNDNEALSEALAQMEMVEGTNAKNKLLWDTLRECFDDDVLTRAGQLAGILRAEQKECGVQNPKCGELMAAEILAKVGMLLNEKEEADGEDGYRD